MMWEREWREGGMVGRGRVNNGTSEEGTERGMDGATEIEAGGSERRNKGAGKEGATERGEEQGEAG